MMTIKDLLHYETANLPLWALIIGLCFGRPGIDFISRRITKKTHRKYLRYTRFMAKRHRNAWRPVGGPRE